MSLNCRFYNHKLDFLRVRDFLKSTYSLDTPSFNWCWARWEYMHFHPLINKLQDDLDKIGVWEDKGKIVAVAHFEHKLGYVYFEVDSSQPFDKKEFLKYAQDNLSVNLKGQRRIIKVYINEFDKEFEKIVKQSAYIKSTLEKEPVTLINLEPNKLKYSLPKGFRVQSLKDENDLVKIHRVMHRGFNHSGEPLEEELEGRKLMQKAPSFCKDTTIVTVAPDGNYASFCGTWYDAKNKFTYIEPVATDQDYRMMGLGRAAVYEALQRNYQKGARKALVGSDQDFYKRLGFKKFFTRYCWIKYF